MKFYEAGNSFSYNVTPVSNCNLKKHIQISNIFEYIKNFFETSEKSNIIYDLYSFWANFLAIVDLPTPVAPSSMTA